MNQALYEEVQRVRHEQGALLRQEAFRLGQPAPAFPERQNIPQQVGLPKPLAQHTYLIDGKLEEWAGPMQEVISPIRVTESGQPAKVTIGSYPLMTAKEGLAAVNAAAQAFDRGAGAWPMMTAEQRIECVERFLDKMVAQRDKVVRLMVWEICKTEQDAGKEFDRTVEYVRESIGALREMTRSKDRVLSAEGIVAKTGQNPLGVVLCMGPFNYPLNETFTTLFPALLTGNTAVVKMPRYGVLLHEPLLKAFQESFPPGVVNTVYGDGKEVVSPIMSSGQVDVLAFIGSSRVADILIQQHPERHRLTSILGLGAKDPAIVLPDADLKQTVRDCVKGALTYNGQRCTALKVMYVHRSIADEFVARLSDAVSNLKAGMPWEKGVVLTPLVEDGKSQYLGGLIEDAAALGARVRNERGGQSEETLFTPAVLYPVTPDMRIFKEEQFGPVIPVVPYDDLNDVLGLVAASPYQQQASVFGQDPAQMGKIVARLRNLVGRVNINSQCQRGPDFLPFNGRRSSALGTLSITDALKAFSLETVVAGQDTEANRAMIEKA